MPAAYTLPAILNAQIQQNGYGKRADARFITSQPAAGSYYAQIRSEDVPTYFDLTLQLDANDALVFDVFLRSDNYAVLNGAQFNITLLTEDGMTEQVASFPPDAIPQLVGVNAFTYTYSMRVMVPRLNKPSAGSEDLILFMANNGGASLLQEIVNYDMPG